MLKHNIKLTFCRKFIFFFILLDIQEGYELKLLLIKDIIIFDWTHRIVGYFYNLQLSSFSSRSISFKLSLTSKSLLEDPSLCPIFLSSSPQAGFSLDDSLLFQFRFATLSCCGSFIWSIWGLDKLFLIHIWILIIYSEF